MRDVLLVVLAHSGGAGLLHSVQRALAREDVARIAVVDQVGSRDFLDLVAGADDRRLEVLSITAGRGAAFRAGIRAVLLGDKTAPFVAILDAEHDPRDLDLLLAPLREGRADAVYGSRRGPPRERRPTTLTERAAMALVDPVQAGQDFALRALAGLAHAIHRVDVGDLHGPKALRRAVVEALDLTSAGEGVDAELTAKLAAVEYRVLEVPVSQGRHALTPSAAVTTAATLARYAITDEYEGRHEGHRTLRAMETAPAYARWLAAKLKPHLGPRVLEIGAGLGTITRHLVDRELLVALEPERLYVERLKNRFAGLPNVEVVHGDAANDADLLPLRARDLDSVVLSNVLEHIPDDADALRRFAKVLRPGGAVVLIVPALQELFGEIDAAVGHHRRYDKRTLEKALAAGGFAIERLEWMNAVGIPGWWLNGRILRRREVPRLQLQVYDRLAPALARAEARFGETPVGMSLFAVGRLPA
jgi:SAM-dependent methyltransferase